MKSPGGRINVSKLALFMLVAVATIAVACGASSNPTPTTPAGSGAAPTQTAAPEPDIESSVNCPTEGAEGFETAKLYIEHNATDEDTGMHGLFGGHGHSEVCVWDPNGRIILMADPTGQLNDLTMADLFFESREPPNSEVSIFDIQSPELLMSGTEYEFELMAVDAAGNQTFTVGTFTTSG